MGDKQKLTPYVYWAQNGSKIYLKINLLDVQNPLIELKSDSLTFSCEETGAHGKNIYYFCLNFYNKLDKDSCQHNILDNCVIFVLVKLKHEWWPRLISQPQKPDWLKIDFDKWQSPEESMNRDVGAILKNYSNIYEQLQEEEIGHGKQNMKMVYLTFYNFFLYIGFLYIFVVLVIKFLSEGVDFLPKAFETTGTEMYIMQSAQLLEIVHPFIGVVKGGALMPFLQIAGRIFVLFGMIGDEPKVQNQPVVFFLFLLWSTIEIIRYPFYITQLYKRNNKILKWLRYNAWIILYPAGFTCELIIYYKNLVFMHISQKWSIEMPNSLNFIFNCNAILRGYVLFIAFPGMFVLLSHMNKSRKQRGKFNKGN